MTLTKMVEAIRAKFAEHPERRAVNITADMPLGPASVAETRAAELRDFLQHAFPDHTLSQNYQWTPRRDKDEIQPAIKRTTIYISRP